MTKTLTGALVLAALSAVSTPPCDEQLHRQFDFWLGSWEVYDGERRLVGTNTITAEEAGCVLIERWHGERSSGMSVNYVDPATAQWRQNWVASSGYIVELAGGLVDGAMVMQGSLTSKDGTTRPMRGKWTPLDSSLVRQQFWLADSTKAWEPWFDGYYERTNK